MIVGSSSTQKFSGTITSIVHELGIPIKQPLLRWFSNRLRNTAQLAQSFMSKRPCGIRWLGLTLAYKLFISRWFHVLVVLDNSKRSNFFWSIFWGSHEFHGTTGSDFGFAVSDRTHNILNTSFLCYYKWLHVIFCFDWLYWVCLRPAFDDWSSSASKNHRNLPTP